MSYWQRLALKATILELSIGCDLIVGTKLVGTGDHCNRRVGSEVPAYAFQLCRDEIAKGSRAD